MGDDVWVEVVFPSSFSAGTGMALYGAISNHLIAHQIAFETPF